MKQTILQLFYWVIVTFMLVACSKQSSSSNDSDLLAEKAHLHQYIMNVCSGVTVPSEQELKNLRRKILQNNVEVDQIGIKFASYSDNKSVCYVYVYHKDSQTCYGHYKVTLENSGISKTNQLHFEVVD